MSDGCDTQRISNAGTKKRALFHTHRDAEGWGNCPNHPGALTEQNCSARLFLSGSRGSLYIHDRQQLERDRQHGSHRLESHNNSPNPKNPPFYLDLPPLAFVDQYIGSLRRYRAISIDVGDQDGLRADTVKLHEVLDKYAIPNSFEVYSGTHTSKVADRFQNHVLPFFGQTLCFQASCQ